MLLSRQQHRDTCHLFLDISLKELQCDIRMCHQNVSHVSLHNYSDAIVIVMSLRDCVRLKRLRCGVGGGGGDSN